MNLSSSGSMRGWAPLLGAAAALVVSACGGPATPATVPARYEGPLAERADAAKGEAIYQRYCDSCHPGGREDVGPALAGRKLSPGKVRWFVREGGDAMPAFPADKVSDEDLEHLAAYVGSL